MVAEITSDEELCIWAALWGMFRITQHRMIKAGLMLTKDQFAKMGFSVMLPAETLLRVARADWPYTVATEGPAPAAVSAVRKNNVRKIVGLG